MEDSEPRLPPTRTLKSPAGDPFASPPRVRVKRAQVVELSVQTGDEFLSLLDLSADELSWSSAGLSDNRSLDEDLLFEALSRFQPDASLSRSDDPARSILPGHSQNLLNVKPRRAISSASSHMSIDAYRANIIRDSLITAEQEKTSTQPLTTSNDNESAQLSYMPKSPPNQYALISPLSVMDIVHLQHLARVHSVKIEMDHVDISFPVFTPFRHLFMSSTLVTKKTAISISLRYSLPITGITDSIQTTITAPNPFSRRNTTKEMTQSTLIRVPVRHDNILPCHFNAYQVDVFLNEYMIVYIEVNTQPWIDSIIPLPTTTKMLRSKNPSSIGKSTINETKERATSLFLGSARIRLAELLRSRHLALKKIKVPIWRTTPSWTSSNLTNQAWKQHYLGDLNISIQLLPAFEESLVDSIPLSTTVTLPSTITFIPKQSSNPTSPVYLNMCFASFSSALPSQPSYLISYLNQQTDKLISTTATDAQMNVSLSTSFRLPSIRDTLLAVECKPVYWYSQRVTTRSGMYLHQVEIDTTHPPHASTSIIPIPLNHHLSIPVVISEILERGSDVPLIVEVWQHTIMFTPQSSTVPVSPHSNHDHSRQVQEQPELPSMDKILLGIAKVPLNHVLQTANYAATFTTWEKVLPVVLSELEYSIVHPVSGQTQGWLSVGMELSAQPKHTAHHNPSRKQSLLHKETMSETQRALSTALPTNTPIQPLISDNDNHSSEPATTVIIENDKNIDKALHRGRRYRRLPRQHSSTTSPGYADDEPLHHSQLRSPSPPPRATNIFEITLHRAMGLHSLASACFEMLSSTLGSKDPLHQHFRQVLKHGVVALVEIAIFPEWVERKGYIENHQDRIFESPVASQSDTPTWEAKTAIRLANIDHRFIHRLQARNDHHFVVTGGIYHRVPQHLAIAGSRNADILIGEFEFPLYRLSDTSISIREEWFIVHLPRYLENNHTANRSIGALQISCAFTEPLLSALQSYPSTLFAPYQATASITFTLEQNTNIAEFFEVQFASSLLTQCPVGQNIILSTQRTRVGEGSTLSCGECAISPEFISILRSKLISFNVTLYNTEKSLISNGTAQYGLIALSEALRALSSPSLVTISFKVPVIMPSQRTGINAYLVGSLSLNVVVRNPTQVTNTPDIAMASFEKDIVRHHNDVDLKTIGASGALIPIRIAVIEANNISHISAGLRDTCFSTYVSFSWNDDTHITPIDVAAGDYDVSLMITANTALTENTRKVVHVTPTVEKEGDPVYQFSVIVQQSVSPLALERLRRGKTIVFKLWQKRSNEQRSYIPDCDRLLGYVKVDLLPLMSGLSEIDGWYTLTDFRGQHLGHLRVGIYPLQPLVTQLNSGTVAHVNHTDESSIAMPWLSQLHTTLADLDALSKDKYVSRKVPARPILTQTMNENWDLQLHKSIALVDEMRHNLESRLSLTDKSSLCTTIQPFISQQKQNKSTTSTKESDTYTVKENHNADDKVSQSTSTNNESDDSGLLNKSFSEIKEHFIKSNDLIVDSPIDYTVPSPLRLSSQTTHTEIFHKSHSCGSVDDQLPPPESSDPSTFNPLDKLSQSVHSSPSSSSVKSSTGSETGEVVVDASFDIDLDFDDDMDLATLIRKSREPLPSRSLTMATTPSPVVVPSSPNFVSVARLKERALDIEREIQLALERYDNLVLTKESISSPPVQYNNNK